MPAIIGHGNPERSLTLTLLPDDWQRARGQVRDFFYRVRREGYALQAAWTTERTKAGDRHLHAATWGDYIPHEVAQGLWGDRYVWLNAIRGSGNGWGRYLGKMMGGDSWSAYMAKQAAEHVADNGGRVLHLTRGYLRGETLTHVRATIRKANRPEVERDWQLVRVGEVEERRAAAMRFRSQLLASVVTPKD